MSKVNQQDIDKLIELVGGRGNIATVSHCITRLRFVLNDPAIARPKEIEQLRMVKGCFKVVLHIWICRLNLLLLPRIVFRRVFC